MKIQYNEEEKSIEIKDGLKTQHFLVKFLLILNLISAIVNLLNLKGKQLDWIGYIWIILGVLSLGILIHQTLRKTTQDNIALNEIECLKEKVVLGKKRFSLKLKSGKLRDLVELKSQSEIS